MVRMVILTCEEGRERKGEAGRTAPHLISSIVQAKSQNLSGLSFRSVPFLFCIPFPQRASHGDGYTVDGLGWVPIIRRTRHDTPHHTKPTTPTAAQHTHTHLHTHICIHPSMRICCLDWTDRTVGRIQKSKWGTYHYSPPRWVY